MKSNLITVLEVVEEKVGVGNCEDEVLHLLAQHVQVLPVLHIPGWRKHFIVFHWHQIWVSSTFDICVKLQIDSLFSQLCILKLLLTLFAWFCMSLSKASQDSSPCHRLWSKCFTPSCHSMAWPMWDWKVDARDNQSCVSGSNKCQSGGSSWCDTILVEWWPTGALVQSKEYLGPCGGPVKGIYRVFFSLLPP